THATEGAPRRSSMNAAKAGSRYGDDSTASSTPCRPRWSSTCARMGRSTSGIRGLGMVSVRGRRRVPSPPTSTTAFMSVLAPAKEDHLGSQSQGQPCERPGRGPPARRPELHEVLVDAPRVLHHHLPRAVAAGGDSADVEHFELRGEHHHPAPLTETGAQVDVLHVHEVPL